MSDLICPHCHTEVPHGATVCRGCQAEVEYGVPGGVLIFLLIVAIIAGIATRNMMLGGWILFIIILIGGGITFNKLFSNRISFKRHYRS
ncbi:hypothetical protein [Sulfuriferula nivalis]|uniref:Zinc ribbon domain-containing protein n=1 Tax=Sulfuriferula nivalis TaxID=2675298 RepID=A0A809SER5_9PROT|nr:hypothetical protein [Sulfuriferula nivalis]BBP01657.1 hypothetical protein SFSGTM_23650 [Sulfuriferula nivalis]